MEKMGSARKMQPRNAGSSGAEGNMKSSEGVIFMLKCLLFSYAITAGLLFLLAFLLYRFALPENVVNISIILIYVAVTFLAGLMVGKKAVNRRFIWGLIMGIIYFAVLAIVSLLINRSVETVASDFATVFLLCAGSGMLGGMVS